MVQQYQDVMAICRWAGLPNLFITFACNPCRKKINYMLNNIPGQMAKDRPDVVTRVFRLKLKELIDDLRKKMNFSTIIASI